MEFAPFFMKVNPIATNHDIHRQKNNFVVAIVLFSIFILQFLFLPTQLTKGMNIENGFFA